MTSPGVALLMGVGPAPAEISRLQDFFAALWHWEPAVTTVTLIDDAPQARDLAAAVAAPDGVRVHSILHPRQGEGSGVYGGLTEGVLLGLDWIATHAPADLVLKIDTDALVIGPFAAKARDLLERCPRAGMIGLYDRHCSGEPRGYFPWDRDLFRRSLPAVVRRDFITKRRKFYWQLWGAAGAQRRILRRARRNRYEWGEHCLGGAYGLRFATLRDMQAQGFLRDPEFWRLSLISEDALVGAYVKAAGWDLAGCAAPGEVFGIEYLGLPFPPEQLETLGYSIIHSVKNDPTYPEDQIRRFFQDRRRGGGMTARER